MKNRRLVTLCIYNIAYRPRMSVAFKLSLRGVVQWKYSWWCMYKYVFRKVAVAAAGELTLASWVKALVLRRLGGSVHYNPVAVQQATLDCTRDGGFPTRPVRAHCTG